jgi:DNA-binding NarL/FixJ family response regulator
VSGAGSGDEVRPPIAVFLLDDHEIVRRGVRDLLEAEPDITVVGEAGTASSALARIPALKPDVAVLDVRLPDGDGVSVCREIRSRMPEVACLMLTSFGDDEALFDAIMAGAAGYVLKQIRGTDLVGAVRTVASGQSMLDPRAASQLMARLRDQSARHDPLAGLSAQERRILELIGEGPDQPADRRADVPGREDREELRVRAVRQAGHGAPHPGGRLRGPRVRRPARRGRR